MRIEKNLSGNCKNEFELNLVIRHIALLGRNSSFDSLDGDNELLGSRISEICILKYCIEMNFEHSQI